MLTIFTSRWWLLALRGAIAVLFGLAAIVWPAIALTVIVLLFGAYALVDGAWAMFLGVIIQQEVSHWWVWLLEGLAGVVIGVLVFHWPAITTLVLLYLIAYWGPVTGMFGILAAVQLRKVIKGEWLLVLGGILSALLGAFLAVFPKPGVEVLVWLVGAYAILFGILSFAFALRLRSLGDALKHQLVVMA